MACRQHLLCAGHLKIQAGAHGCTYTIDITLLHMSTVLAQVHCDAVGTRSFTGEGKSQGVRFDLVAVIEGVFAVARLTDCRTMVNVDP